MEANGGFSMIESDEQQPGLMVLPDWDKEFILKKLNKTDVTICKNCGTKKPDHLAKLNGSAKCEKCGNNEWTKAVVNK